MSNSLFFGFIMAVLLGVSHYFGELIWKECRNRRYELISFGVGITITYTFLQLLPELNSGVELIAQYSETLLIVEEVGRKLLFFLILIGFMTFHIIHKYMFKDSEKIKNAEKEHIVVYTMYYFAIGFILPNVSQNLINIFLFFLLVIIHDIIANMRLARMHRSKSGKFLTKAVMPLATLLGASSGLFFDISKPVFIYSLLAFVGGAIMYIVFKEEMPEERIGRPSYFLLGMMLVTFLSYISWVIT